MPGNPSESDRFRDHAAAQELDQDRAESQLIDAQQNQLYQATDLAATQIDKQLCQICFMERPTRCFYALNCSHEYCHHCISNHLKSKIEARQSDRMNCMHPDCRESYKDEHVRRFLNDTLYHQYAQTVQERKLVNSDGKIKWCCRPDCFTLVEKPRGCFNRGYSKCTTCLQEMCFKCGAKWHQGKCGNYFETLPHEVH